MNHNDKVMEWALTTKEPIFNYMKHATFPIDELEIVDTLEEYMVGNGVDMPSFLAYYLEHGDMNIKSKCFHTKETSNWRDRMDMDKLRGFVYGKKDK